jgi:hypothetical protein
MPEREGRFAMQKIRHQPLAGIEGSLTVFASQRVANARPTTGSAKQSISQHKERKKWIASSLRSSQ